MLFLKDASDRLEIEKGSAPIVREVEQRASKIFGSSWMELLSPTVRNELESSKFRKYKTRLVRDLLRVVRNKAHHYRDLPEEVQLDFGVYPDEYVSYFQRRFPMLSFSYLTCSVLGKAWGDQRGRTRPHGRHCLVNRTRRLNEGRL